MAAAGTVILLVLAAGCGGSPTAPSPTARTGPDLAPDQLARAVAERLVPADFVESLGEGLTLDVRGDLLFIRGVVSGSSHRETSALLNGSPGVRTAVLTLVPGSLDDETNFGLGRMLRAAGVTTYLPSRGLVASGGTDLFLAGRRRIVERGARVGVHSWASGSVNGDEVPRDDLRHQPLPAVLSGHRHCGGVLLVHSRSSLARGHALDDRGRNGTLCGLHAVALRRFVRPRRSPASGSARPPAAVNPLAQVLGTLKVLPAR